MTLLRISYKIVAVLIIFFMINSGLLIGSSSSESVPEYPSTIINGMDGGSGPGPLITDPDRVGWGGTGPGPRTPGPDEIDDTATKGRSESRAGELVFTDVSQGLQGYSFFNYVDLADFNKDGDMDVVFAAQKSQSNVSGLYAYLGNGGTSWTNSSAGLWRGNSWAALDVADADGDGYMELYAADETTVNNNSGVRAFEYRGGSWTASVAHVTTPLKQGQPDYVKLINVTGDSKLDMVVANGSGMKYFENQGGNPVVWRDISTGLPTSGMFTAMDVADINKDGLVDIVVMDYSDGENIFIHNTTGGFHWSDYSSSLSVTGNNLAVAIGDVNLDTHMDLVIGTHSSNSGVDCYLGNSGGVSGTDFTWTLANTGMPTNRRYYGVRLVDIDVDGDLDVVAARSSGNLGPEIFLGNGSTLPGPNMGWTKALNTNLPTTGDWYTVDCADINGDGSLDIAGASWGKGIAVWRSNITFDITAPGAVLNLAVTNVTTTTITINWTAPADNGTNASSGPAAEYDLRYSTTAISMGTWPSNSQVADEPAPAAPGTPQQYNLTGLQPGTQYYIAIRCRDERPNYSPLSNIVQATTLGVPDTTPPAAIIDLAAVDPTNNTIDLTWTAPADNGTNAGSGTVAEYDIRYHTSTINAGNFGTVTRASAPIIPSTPGATEQYIITDLAGNTTYYFAVKARDENNNWGLISNIATGKTLADPDITAPFGVNDLNALEPTNTSVNLTWTAVGDDGNSGQAVLYDIRYSTTTITLVSWDSAAPVVGEPSPQAAGNTELFTIAGLNPDTTYYFGIMVRDEMLQWSPLSNIASNTTLADPSPDLTPPARITDLEATGPTINTLTLTWTAPGDDDDTGTASAYDIRYSTSMIGDANWAAAFAVTSPPAPKPAGQPETFVVTGLDPDTTYFFAVKTADEAGLLSELSNIAFGTTLAETEPPQVLPELFVSLSAQRTTLNSTESADLNILVRTVSTQAPVAQVTVNTSSANAEVVIDPATANTAAGGTAVITIGAPDVSVMTNFTVNVEISKAGYSANASSITFTVIPSAVQLKFNLRITDSAVNVNRTKITEGELVTISANITNTGDRYSTGFDVRFYINDTQIGSDTRIVILKAKGFVIVSTEWTALAGTHLIRVDAAAVNVTLESDLSDNSGEREITVLKQSDPGPIIPGPDDEEAEKNASSNMFAYLLIALIVVIVIIVLLFFIMRRRKPVFEYPMPPPPPPPPAEEINLSGEMRDEMEDGEMPSGEAVDESREAIEEIPPMAEPVPAGEMRDEVEEVESPLGEGVEGTGEAIAPSGETEGEVPPAPEQPVSPEQPAEQPPAEQPQEQPPVQMVPCPTCGNQIAAFSTPCPHCSTTLNWG